MGKLFNVLQTTTAWKKACMSQSTVEDSVSPSAGRKGTRPYFLEYPWHLVPVVPMVLERSFFQNC